MLLKLHVGYCAQSLHWRPISRSSQVSAFPHHGCPPQIFETTQFAQYSLSIIFLNCFMSRNAPMSIHDVVHPIRDERARRYLRRVDAESFPTCWIAPRAADPEHRGPSNMCGLPPLQWVTRNFSAIRRCASDIGINQSKHSRRILPITRSQIAFAVGLRGGDFSTLKPRWRMDSSRSLAKMLSRS